MMGGLVKVSLALQPPGIEQCDIRHAGLQMMDQGIEVRPAQHYTQHAAGIYQGAKPVKLKGLAHAKESVHRVSARLQARM